MKTDTNELDHARQQGQAQYEHIQGLVADLRDHDHETIRPIYEHPLSVLVRSGWHEIKSSASAPAKRTGTHVLNVPSGSSESWRPIRERAFA